jgi:hypothetical protein
MKEEVKEAIVELEEGAPGEGVLFLEDGDGGAHVIVEGVPIGASFSPNVSWIGFHILHSYPDADVYPHMVDAGLRYIGSGEAPSVFPDGNLPTAMSRGDFLASGFDRPAIQISRASNRRTAENDSALQKLLRVIDFLETR